MLKIEPNESIECREVLPSELPEAIRTIIRDCPEIPYFAEKKPDVFIPKYLALVGTGIARSYGAFLGARCVGLMLGIFADDLLSDKRQSTELVWQVHPDFRKTGIGPKLLKMFEEASREVGCHRVVFGASTEWNYPSMLRLYKKLGYSPISMGVAKTL